MRARSILPITLPGLCAMVMLMAPVLDAASAPRELHAAQCTVSTDPTYAYTRENPVRIGGGASTVAAREQRYMDAPPARVLASWLPARCASCAAPVIILSER